MYAKKRIWSNLFYLYLKKHYCPNCGARLVLIKMKKVINSKSEEAKMYDFQNVDNFYIGNVEFIWDELKCYECGYQATIKDFKKLEKIGKKK